MRLPDDNKRRQIISTAAGMFAAQPYHKVRLDDVATTAGVGKGTLYVYFQSKEELYFTIIYEGVGYLLERLKTQLAVDHSCAMHRLRTIVSELVDFNFQYPQFFEVIRSVGLPKNVAQWDAQREQLFELIEQTIRAGVAAAEMRDAHPKLTARFIPGLVRSAMLFAQSEITPELLKQQICSLLESGLGCGLPSKLSV
jgi:AcrR family transcriptional regulator